ncbi:hypothetical protein P692DRAFT_20715738, partial [Suillus brevipes Sb2]
LPLTLTWAMTGYKSQSLTLDKIVVDLNKAFTDTLTLPYVALSRAGMCEGLQIQHFNKVK